ncbi:MAG: hypothetical protein IKR48_06540 [Kiritimatiellae bacterium]|nr:hypothetical protein [Kiritimatiellia bacterium]
MNERSGDTTFDDKSVVAMASPSYRTTRDMGHETCTISSLLIRHSSLAALPPCVAPTGLREGQHPRCL